MRVPSDEEASKSTGAFTDLLRLQTEFQARLADETLRYLRRIGGALAPAAPGTVVLSDAGTELAAAGPPGGRATLRVEVDNLQRVHCVLSPALTPLVSAAGVTWFPEVDPTSGSQLLEPGETGSLALDLALPKALPAGTYRGALLLQGFRQEALPVAVAVIPSAAAQRTAKTAEKKPAGEVAAKGAGRSAKRAARRAK